MAESNGHRTTLAGVGVRVGLLEQRDIDIEKQVNIVRDTMATRVDMAAVATQLRADIAAIAVQIQTVAERQNKASAPNYNLMIGAGTLLVMFMSVIGGLAYLPINSATTRLETAMAVLADKAITTHQYDADLSRITSNALLLRSDLTGVQERYVQQQRVARDEVEFNGLRDKAVLRDEFTAVVNGRGIIIEDLRDRVKRLEDAAMKH